jgi:hypothetical protein
MDKAARKNELKLEEFLFIPIIFTYKNSSALLSKLNHQN